MPKKLAGSAGAGGRKVKAAGKRTRKASSPASASASAASPALRVKQIRSGIGHAETYRRTLVALGLKHHQDEVVVRDVPSVRGMLRKVWHLVSVRPVEG
jgi:large subunit ribosomal protein L30